jgi:hypothetical protein
MTETNLLPEFHELLREALSASDEADLFDVHSEIPESKAKWDDLRRIASEAEAKLIVFIQDNPQILPQVLSLTKSESPSTEAAH